MTRLMCTNPLNPVMRTSSILDLAAIQALINRGAVYAVMPEEVPGQSILAAVLRY